MKNSRFYKAIEEHEKWLNSGKKEGFQLVLKNEDLSFIEIYNKNLDEAIIENCDLTRAIIENTSINNAIIKNCNFGCSIINNSTFKKSYIVENEFYISHLEQLSVEDSIFNKNKFIKANIKNSDFLNVNFYENNYFKAKFKEDKFIESFFNKDVMIKILAENFLLKNSYFNAHIENSIFIDSISENNYINVKSEESSFINTLPHDFFERKVLNIKNNLFIDYLLKRINAIEIKIISLKIEEDIENFKEGLEKFKFLLFNLNNEIEYIEYIVDDLKNLDSKEVNHLMNKIAKLKSLLYRKRDLIESYGLKGNEDE